MTSDDDYQTPSMSRREALAGGSAAAVAVGAGLMSSSLVRRAQALSAGDARIVMGDQGSSPAQNGELTHNTGDVEVYSGGSVRNLTSPAFEDVKINNSVTYPDGTTYTTHPNVDGTDISPSGINGTVHVRSGDDLQTKITNNGGNTEYLISGSHTVPNITETISNVTFRGQENTVLNWDTNSTTWMFDITGDNINFRDLAFDLKVDTGAIRVAGNDVRIKDCEFTDHNNQSAISVGDQSALAREGWKISDCLFDGSQQAITLNDEIHDCSITNNSIIGATGSKVIDVGTGDDIFRSKITGNYIGNRSSNVAGLRLYNGNGTVCNHVIIANNTFENCDVWAVHGDFRDCTIRGNVGTGSMGTAGIHLRNGRDTNVVGNALESGGGHGIYVELTNAGGYDAGFANSMSISGNTLSGFNNAGIRLEGVTSTAVTGNMVKNNSQSGLANSSGIELADGPTATEPSVNNQITGNISHRGNQDHGIEELGNADYNQITNNQVHDNTNAGVATVGANTVTANNNATDA